METSYYTGLNYNNNATLNTYIIRGGCFNGAHTEYPPVFRGYHSAPSTLTNYGFRTTLYFQ